MPDGHEDYDDDYSGEDDVEDDDDDVQHVQETIFYEALPLGPLPSAPLSLLPPDQRLLISDDYLKSLSSASRDALFETIIDYKLTVELLIRQRWALQRRCYEYRSERDQIEKRFSKLRNHNTGLASKLGLAQQRLQDLRMKR
ncbi:hypothetical protein GQ602_002439 [Ophiocordyceps camponoti-floridani]|uniref:Uncharacterized protein n=1 Tax=Ophiocordyceps camponoti-floridani TaxID=2030778 RepID=A0A8H4QAJ6_9HYPO|nr:hypothetical protein GQ602_002439 [Ophiocordyceps camponoti-floridani]